MKTKGNTSMRKNVLLSQDVALAVEDIAGEIGWPQGQVLEFAMSSPVVARTRVLLGDACRREPLGELFRFEARQTGIQGGWEDVPDMRPVVKLCRALLDSLGYLSPAPYNAANSMGMARGSLDGYLKSCLDDGILGNLPRFRAALEAGDWATCLDEDVPGRVFDLVDELLDGIRAGYDGLRRGKAGVCKALAAICTVLLRPKDGCSLCWEKTYDVLADARLVMSADGSVSMY